MVDKNNLCIGTCYAGHGKGMNNPALQEVHDIGPLPCGLYTIKPPEDTETHGPFVLRLEPHPENEMFGRDEFLIHGDRKGVPPGNASLGCIVAGLLIRQRIAASGDHLLEVVA